MITQWNWLRILSPFMFVALFSPLQGQDFMMQGWYWGYPKPTNPNGNPNTEFTWAKNLEDQVDDLGSSGFTYLWAPPLSRASFGSNSNGYDPQDLYDLGEYGLGATGFGFRQDVDALIAAGNMHGVNVVADVVYNHRDGGLPEANPAVRDYITTYYDGPNAGENPFPSDRYRVILPLGGSSGNGAGDYYFKISSKTQHPDFHGDGYKIYMETNVTGYQGQPAVNELEPNGGGDCNLPFNMVSLGIDLLANLDDDPNQCMTDEFKLTLQTGDFNPAGDTLFIYLSNTSGGYSDHRIYGLWSTSANADISNQLIYQTYTDFTNLPSGMGSTNFECFRPNSNTVTYEKLDGDWNSLLFFYDYDQSQSCTQTELEDWTSWLWNNVGIRGFRADAVKHFDPAFFGNLMDHLHNNGINPGMVVGEYFSTNAIEVAGWINSVESNMNPGTLNSIDVRAFDFSLRQALKNACDQFGYDVRQVFNTGLKEGAGADPFNVVTFINNHDYRHTDEPVQNDPMLAYAYILTNNQVGLPCVFYPDYYGVSVPNAPTVNLQQEIDELIQVHQQYIYQSANAEYLSNFNSGYNQFFVSGYANTSLIYQLQGAPTGKDVIVAINFAGEAMEVYQQINLSNASVGDPFTDILDYSNGPAVLTVNNNQELHLQLPPRSYSVWVQGNLAPLPLSWRSFEAFYQDEQVHLEWAADWEEDLKQYVLERSLDGKTFAPVHTREAWNSETPVSYTWVDETLPKVSLLYYRLKAVNLDETYEYSDMRAVELPGSGANVQIYPNPVKGELQLDMELIEEGLLEISLYNSLGQEVYSRALHPGAGWLQQSIDVSAYPAGAYFLRLQQRGRLLATERIVVDY